MNGTGANILAVLAAIVLLGSRRWAILALAFAMLYLPAGQSISVAGLNFFPMRILEVFAFIRIVVRGEIFEINLNGIDRIVIALYACLMLMVVMRSDPDQKNVIAISLDSVLCYFSFRSLWRSVDDLQWFLRAFALLLIPFVALVADEMLSKANPFASLGGLQFVERDGRVRCMGTFRHPSLLGTLGAAFIPLYFGAMTDTTRRATAVVGVLACTAIVFLANSGGPLSATAFGVIGWLCWPLRNHMRSVRRGLLVLLVLLALFMKAPLWYLPAKASSLSGGDGWHRAYLMDMAFQHIGGWGMAGVNISQTADWFPYTLAATGSADITNQYVFFGLTAGLPAVLLFVALLVRAFSAVGDLVARLSAGPTSQPHQMLAWCLGSSVLVHAATWFGITYNFDQTYVIWCLQLAAIATFHAASAPRVQTSGPAVAHIS